MSFLIPNIDRAVTNAERRTKNSGPWQRQQGLTIMELVIMIGLVGVVSAVAIPNVGRTLDLHRVDTATSLLAGKLSEARMNAIKRNRQAWVAIDPGNRTVRVQTTNTAGATINVGASETLPPGVNFGSPSTVTQVRFDSLGRLPTGTPAWTLTLRGAQNTQQKSVTISAAGRINVTNMSSYYQ